MKVICLQQEAFHSTESGQIIEKANMLTVGDFYHVVDEHVINGFTYWELAEFPRNPGGRINVFNPALFGCMSEIDEAELVNEREILETCKR